MSINMLTNGAKYPIKQPENKDSIISLPEKYIYPETIQKDVHAEHEKGFITLRLINLSTDSINPLVSII